nr:MAG TPA: hypothetical protein [Caudoviricetes sp.]
MSLLDKSAQNFEIARIASEKKYFDVAVSRLYYSSYQKIIYYKNDKMVDGNSQFEMYKQEHGNDTETEKYGSHDWNIAFFEEKNKTLGLDGYESIISFLKDMKISRNTADYKKKRVCIESDEYEKLENKTKLINAMIDKIIGD